ncbi:MAG: dipeptidyl aminopeptidase/acylaminoacyl peptidase [Alphaproteobacteria bacterium]|jgi:dipeptidyl aminopeptidase/acylaminoacyl peptidase
MHGNADVAVPLINAEIMIERLKAKGVEHAYIECEDTSHSPTVDQTERAVTEPLTVLTNI